MRRWRVLLVALILLAVLGQPSLLRGHRGDRVVLGRDLTLGEGQQVEGDLVVLGGHARLEAGSNVRGDVLVIGGSLQVAGRVGGKVCALNGDIELDSTALVAGDVVASGRVRRGSEAKVGGQVAGSSATGAWPLSGHWWQWSLANLPGLWFGWPWGAGLSQNPLVWAMQALLGSLVAVSFAILTGLLLPQPVHTAAVALGRQPVQSIIVGLLAGPLVGAAALLLAVTCLGIPLAVLAALGLAGAWLFGWIVAGQTLGERLLAALGPSRPRPLAAVALGTLALSLLAAVPCLGLVTLPLAGTWGAGALILTRFGTVPFLATPPQVAPDPPAGGPGGAR